MSMRRKPLVWLAARFALSSSLILFVCSASLSQVNRNVAYRLIWEKSYEKELKKAAFGSEDGKLYPRMAIFEDEVLFLENSGNVLRKQELLSIVRVVESAEQGTKVIQTVSTPPIIFLSRSGKYIGIEPAPSLTVEYEFRVLDARGREVWRRTKPIAAYDESPSYLISDRDGSIAFVRTVFGGIKFIHGDSEKQISRAPYRPDGAFSDEGEYFAAVFRETPISQSLDDSVNTGLWVALYDRAGTELWRRQLPGAQVPGHIDVSPHGRYIVASGLKGPGVKGPITGISTCVFDENGDVVLLSEPIRFGSGMSRFSGDSRLVALSRPIDRVVKVFEAKTGNKVFEHEFEDRPVRILLSGNGSVLVVETHKRIQGKDRRIDYCLHNDARVFVFAIPRGELVWTETFRGAVYGMLPSLDDISSDGKQIAFKFENRLAIYGE